MQFGEEFVADVLFKFRRDARDENTYHQLDGGRRHQCDNQATDEKTDGDPDISLRLALFAHGVELDAGLRAIEQRAKAQDPSIESVDGQIRLGWIGEVDRLAFAILLLDLQLGNRNLEHAVFRLEVHVPTVEADSALNGLLAEIRVTGMSDKRWNVLCQNAACLA